MRLIFGVERESREGKRVRIAAIESGLCLMSDSVQVMLK